MSASAAFTGAFGELAGLGETAEDRHWLLFPDLSSEDTKETDKVIKSILSSKVCLWISENRRPPVVGGWQCILTAASSASWQQLFRQVDAHTGPLARQTRSKSPERVSLGYCVLKLSI